VNEVRDGCPPVRSCTSNNLAPIGRIEKELLTEVKQAVEKLHIFLNSDIENVFLSIFKNICKKILGTNLLKKNTFSKGVCKQYRENY
jgi:hypothetical protein